MANIGSGNGSGYPSALDTQSPPESGTTLARDDVPNDLAAAVIAAQTELGINPAGTETDVKTYLQTEHNTDGTHGEVTVDKVTMEGDFLFLVGSSAASASALSLGDGTIFDVTGTVNIDSIGTKGVGAKITLRIVSGLTFINDDDDLDLGSNLVVPAGKSVSFYEYAVGKWRSVSFFDTIGKVLQVVTFQDGGVATGSTGFQLDDTIPQNTEGDEFMSLSITPTDSTSKLIIQVTTVFAATSVFSNAPAMVALFQDSIANAIAAVLMVLGDDDKAYTNTFSHSLIAGTTSSIAFKVRIGSNVGDTLTFNGTGGTRLFGGVMASSITITEVEV